MSLNKNLPHRLFLKKISLPLTLALVAFPSYSNANPCHGIFDNRIQKNIFEAAETRIIFLQRGNFSRRDLQGLANVITKINEFSRDLPQPRNLEIGLYRTHPDPQLHPRRGHISLGTRTATQDPRFSRLILAHKYGQLIFERSLSHFVAEWSHYNDILDRLENSLRETNVAIVNYLKILPKLDYEKLSHDEQQLLKNQIKENNERVHTFQADKALLFEDLSFFTAIEEPYAKLFSDLVAILYSGDLDALEKSTSYPDNPLFQIPSGQIPIRSLLHKMSKHQSFKQYSESETLNLVFHACAHEIKLRLHGVYSWKKWSPETTALSLIQTIERLASLKP